MSNYRRRTDPIMIEEIKKFRNRCIDAMLDEEKIMFAEYKAIPNATRLEHAAAKYPIFFSDKKKSIKADILKQYNEELRTFNKTVKDLDMEIIGVDQEFEDLSGERFKLSFMQLAEGIKAKKAAEREEKCARGHLDKSKRLIEMGNNPDLKNIHNARMRAIRRLLDRRGKRE